MSPPILQLQAFSCMPSGESQEKKPKHRESSNELRNYRFKHRIQKRSLKQIQSEDLKADGFCVSVPCRHLAAFNLLLSSPELSYSESTRIPLNLCLPTTYQCNVAFRDTQQDSQALLWKNRIWKGSIQTRGWTVVLPEWLTCDLSLSFHFYNGWTDSL